VRKLIDNAYQITKKLLIEKKGDVEKLAKELLKKEVLFKSDVEALIGKRPYEEKKVLDVIDDAKGIINDEPSNVMPEELKTPPAI
jgi:cell division protease FtsH